MTPERARLKLAAQAAVDRCGGIDGAAATVGRGRSVAGDWHNINHASLPPLELALLLDKVAVARGMAPAITQALAVELGLVLVARPDAADGVAGNVEKLVLRLAEEFGVLAREVSVALDDDRITAAEAAKALGALARLEAVSARLRLALAQIGEE